MTDDRFRPPASGAAPWIGAEHSYAGWVPNVSGHLSFNLVDPHGRAPVYNHQINLTSPRTVVAHHKRLAQDYPFWDWVVKIFRKEARQDFLLLGESGAVKTPYFDAGTLKEIDDEHGALCGILAVLPIDDTIETGKNRKALLDHVDGRIAGATACRARGSVDPNERLAREITTELDAARSHLAIYVMRFSLFRTGELRIWFDLSDFLGRDLVAEPATSPEKELAARLPAQAYYFVKDLLHAHYHHNPHSDQILQLTCLSSGDTDAAVLEDEIRWRYVTLRGLVRVIVELRQSRSFHGHKRALGIIAYAKAFQAVLAKIARTRLAIIDTFSEHGGIIPYEFDNLAMSIDATDSSMESANSSRLQFFAIEVGILLSALALWAGAVQIQPILCGALAKEVVCPKVGPGPIVSIVNDVVANPLGFTILLLVAGFVFFIMIFRGSGAIPAAERFIRWLNGLSDALAVQISRLTAGSDGLGWVLALIGLAGATGYMGHLAYRLAPKTYVPPIEKRAGGGTVGPWSALQTFVDKPAGESGLLTRSVVAQDLRNLVGEDYHDIVRLLGRAVLHRWGEQYYAVSGSGAVDDGAFLILDPKLQRIEATLRVDGRLRPHRSPGREFRRPMPVMNFLGMSSVADTEPVAIEAPGCDIVQGGTDGRALQLRGTLKAGAYCDYGVALQAGQSITFDDRTGRGLYVNVMDGGRAYPIRPIFTAKRSGKQVVRVGWEGWHPAPADALKTRKFYARLDIH